jgi:hypothetical protein
MTVVPLPASPCLRVRMIWNEGVAGEGGTRFYLSYAGSAPTGANCTTLAGDIESAWATDLAPLAGTTIVLNEIDVLDIATDSGLSGQWTGSSAGTRDGGGVPWQVCANVEYGIARRYRGGKPRGFWPFGLTSDMFNNATWSNAFVGDVNSGIEAFFTAVQALDVGAVGALAHVNLSYYKGFTNIANSSGRERAVPTYKTTASLDTITGYATKVVAGSQKRRRTSTTP